MRRNQFHMLESMYINLEARLSAKVMINMPNDGIKREQQIDYENIPFKCIVCSEYNHLTITYPHIVAKSFKPKVVTDGF